MSEETFIEKFKFACSVTSAATGLMAIMSGISVYDEYTIGKTDDLMLKITIGCAIVAVVSGIISFLIGRLLKNEDSLTLKDWLEILGMLVLPQSPEYKIEQFGADASKSKLWKKMGKGISIKNVLLLLLFVGLAVLIGYGAYNIWYYKDGTFGILSWGDSETFRLPLITHVLICLVLVGYSIVFSMKLKINGEPILEYITTHHLDFDQVCQDFSEATYCGGAIWVGTRFLYVRQISSGNMIPIEEIKSVEHNRAFAKLYYFLIIEAEEQTVIQYHIDMGPYYRLCNELEQRGIR